MIINAQKNTVVATRVQVASNLFSRMAGLIGKKGLSEHQALLIRPCQQIHTFFMRFPLDCLFIDDNWRVAGMCQRLEPWRVSPKFPEAATVLELPSGTINRTATNLDDILVYKEKEAMDE